MKKTTVKEVKLWMKTLEENRYKKTYNSDARRVAYFINMGEGNELPSSLRRKTEGSKYSREKFLAREFLKWKTEQRLRESIRRTIKRLI